MKTHTHIQILALTLGLFLTHMDEASAFSKKKDSFEDPPPTVTTTSKPPVTTTTTKPTVTTTTTRPTSTTTTTRPTSSNPTTEKERMVAGVPLWEGTSINRTDWTANLEASIEAYGQNLLDVIPADRSLFCPRYEKLTYEERMKYWVFIISAMAKFESGLKPETSYKEGFDDSNGDAVISRGLLQISIESANSYGCGFKNAQELHDPNKNLSCGVRILDRWLDRDGRIAGKVDGKWRGGARYWSVLRAGDKTSYNSIVSWSQNLAMCKN